MAGLTKRAVNAAKPKETEYFIWCESTPGFGLRVYPSGKKVFISQVRVGRATRRVKIGATTMLISTHFVKREKLND